MGKLERDRIPEIIKQNGGEYDFWVLDDQEYFAALKNKLQEETVEFLDDDNPEELADILEVVYALGISLGLSEDELNNVRHKKAAKRGKFEDKIFMEKKKDE